MNDIVIPLGDGSHWQDNELRYSLRGIEKFVKNVRNVVIVGECPEWVRNVVHIPAVDRHGHERNIYEKVMVACNNQLVSENFLFWNDDFFPLAEIDATRFPFYYNGSLSEAMQRRKKFDGYRMSIENTANVIGPASLYLDIHAPIVYNKRIFVSGVGAVEWRVPNGYVIKSLYGFHAQGLTPFLPLTDLKFHGTHSLDHIRKKIAGRPLFSVSDAGLTNIMKDFIHSLYPEKSKYEA